MTIGTKQIDADCLELTMTNSSPDLTYIADEEVSKFNCTVNLVLLSDTGYLRYKMLTNILTRVCPHPQRLRPTLGMD